ncbi:MAG: hypothetical protein WB791_01255 [Waddliaceae bacterium]
MFAFFRKYERLFFIFITIVIVVSFTFFGTYSALQESSFTDPPAFTAIDGTQIPRSEVEDLALFLGTDSDDKLLFGGSWGPNFLNDGVVKKDFLETGLAEVLTAPYLPDMQEELQAKHRKEQRFSPYTHPDAAFISAVNAWNLAAPDINAHYMALMTAEQPATPEAFASRAKLFLAERRFPALILRLLLRQQERQYRWVNHDPGLDRADLALFGYRTLDDWFGPRFLRLVAEFIINSAIIAEQQGYEVSKAEALADLYHHAEESFYQNSKNPNLGVANVDQYFSEQLRRMRMDKSKALALWQQVMLFRRLFGDLGSSVLVDPFSIKEFQADAKKTIEGDLYQLPEPLRFGDYSSLQKFELYLNAVSKRPQSGKELLRFPETFYTVDEVQERYPELIQRKFLLKIAKVDKNVLQAKVGVKQAWDWEVEEENWEKLKQKFPELGIKPGETKEERFASLQELDNKTRARVDVFTRLQIVDEHPKWICQSLQEAESRQRVVGMPMKGRSEEFSGLKNPQVLVDLFDRYPESQEALSCYTADGAAYYQIEVVDRSSNPEVLSFAEANQAGILDRLLEKTLREHFAKMKEETPEKYRGQQFLQAGYDVADDYFANLLDEINADYTQAATPGEDPKPMIGDYAASLRFYAYLRGLRDQFEQDPSRIQSRLQAPTSEEQRLPPPQKINDQWRLVKTPYQANKSEEVASLNKEEVFALEPEQWSSVYPGANGDLSFFYLRETRSGAGFSDLLEEVMETHRFLSADAKKALMNHLLARMLEKHALSLDFLDAPPQRD